MLALRMSEVSELEARQLAGAFRPNRKPLWIALAANLTMAALLLGVPYWRGHRLGLAARHDFAVFARCLLGGDLASSPGLSLPPGERDHFAARVMFAKAQWPLSCRSALDKLAPPEAIFLWPSVKQAGADQRAAVELVERELVALDQRRKRGVGRVPSRPLDALARLQAASVLYAHATGADAGIDEDAIRFDKKAGPLATPARLPLMASQTSILQLWSSELALEAIALDGRGLSYVRVADGKIDRERVRRSSFVRGVLRADATPYVVWAMPDARCKDRVDHCVGRPTGIAPYDSGANNLGEPTWKLAGHPAGRLDRVMRVSELGRVDLIARSDSAGSLELLQFRLPDHAADTAAAASPSLEPTERWPLSPIGNGVTAQLLVSNLQPNAVLQLGEDSDVITASVSFAAQRPAVALPNGNGQGGWGVGCYAGQTLYLAYGSSQQLRVSSLAADGQGRELSVRDGALAPALDAENPALDQVRVLCDDTRMQLLFTTATHALHWLGCEPERCTPARLVAKDVTSYSAVNDGDAVIAAFAGPLDAAVVRVVRMQGERISTPIAASACWEPLGGMCGTPTLIRDAQRLVLTARDGSDLLALESRDHANSFTTLSGLVVSSGFEPSTISPLKQHRLRKGLE